MASDHFSGHAADYARARPSYPPGLLARPARQCAAHELAWDCGTGNGQAARALAVHFHRVLKPGGLLAAWTYTLLRGEPGRNVLIEDFYRNTVGPWWPPERRWVDLGYRDMAFPFADIAAPEFEIRLEWALDDLLAYLRTWSATQRYIRERGADPCVELGARLRDGISGRIRRRENPSPGTLHCAAGDSNDH